MTEGKTKEITIASKSLAEFLTPGRFIIVHGDTDSTEKIIKRASCLASTVKVRRVVGSNSISYPEVVGRASAEILLASLPYLDFGKEGKTALSTCIRFLKPEVRANRDVVILAPPLPEEKWLTSFFNEYLEKPQKLCCATFIAVCKATVTKHSALAIQHSSSSETTDKLFCMCLPENHRVFEEV